MSTRKKRIILGISGGVLALGLVGVIASQNTFNIGIGVRAEDPANVVWKHYAAVEASPIMHGSKEFWANCSDIGTHSLTKPTTGKIEDGENFSETNYFTELNSSDNRYAAYEEATTYYEGWKKEDFTVETPAAFLNIKSSSFAGSASEFGKTDNDGWVMRLSDDSSCGSITLPKTNFHDILKGGKIAKTEIGGYNGWTNIQLTAGGKETSIQRNEKDQSVACLTRVSLTIYEDAGGKVHLNFVDTLVENPCKDSTRFGEIILTEDEASGNSALKIRSTEKGKSRHYWLGKFRFTNGERVYKDFSAKEGYTTQNAASYNFEEAKTKKYSPYGQVYASIHPTNLAVGICGTGSSSATVTLDKTNYKGLLDNNEGVYFTLGAWNGGEPISFVNQGKEVNLGLNAAKPDNPVNHTKESIKNTWKNWQIAINKAGMHVYNVFENTYTTFALTDKQLNGEESLVFKLANQSNNKFFLLTNMVTYAL